MNLRYFKTDRLKREAGQTGEQVVMWVIEGTAYIYYMYKPKTNPL